MEREASAEQRFAASTFRPVAEDDAVNDLASSSPGRSGPPPGRFSNCRYRNCAYFELRADVLNVFDNTNFDTTVPVFSTTGAGAAATIFQATAAYRDPNNTFDPGGRLGSWCSG
jgi:hypothetical protein